jgi:hypothetical protein
VIVGSHGTKRCPAPNHCQCQGSRRNRPALALSYLFWTLAKNALERLAPPSDLSEEGRRIFTDIVLANEPTQFRASDLPLLCSYVRAVLQEQTASAHLEPLIAHGGRGTPMTWQTTRESDDDDRDWPE